MDKKIFTTLIVGGFLAVVSMLCLYDIISTSNTIDMEVLSLSGIMIAIILGVVYAVKQRIDEIKGGETNDISKY